MTNEAIEAWMESCRGLARKEFEENGKIQFAKAALLATQDPQTRKPLPEPGTIILVATDFAPEDREKFAKTIKIFARQSAALALVFITEVWVLVATEAQRRKIEGSFEHVPGRAERLMCICRKLSEFGYYLGVRHHPGRRGKAVAGALLLRSGRRWPLR